MKAIAFACVAFCTARMYAGGFSVKQHPEVCFCYEAVDRRTPAAMIPFALTWFKRPIQSMPVENDDTSYWELLKDE